MANIFYLFGDGVTANLTLRYIDLTSFHLSISRRIHMTRGHFKKDLLARW